MVTNTPARFFITRAPVTNSDSSSAPTWNGTQTASAPCSMKSRFNNSGDFAVVRGSPTKPYSRVVPLICETGCTSAGAPRRLASREFQLIHRCEDRRGSGADQKLKLLLESGPRYPYVCGRVPFDQNYP